MKQIIWLATKISAFALVSIFFLPACAAIAQYSTLPTLKIGLVAPFEGLYRPLGYEALFGVKLALLERNLGQGLHGYRVELVALNDFNDPAEAQLQAKALIADPDVVGVVGHLSAAATQAAMPVYQQAGLALSVPWTIAPAGSENPRQGMVSVAANQAETAARLDSFKRDLGWFKVVEVKDQHVSAMPAEAQAVELAVDAVTAGQAILALKGAGVDLPLLGQVEAGSFQLVQVAGEAANGFIYVSPGPDPEQAADTETFVQKYTDLAGFPPGPRAVLAYDAANVLLDAIETAISAGKPLTRSEVSAVVGQVQRRGLSGKIAFDARGQRVDAPVWLYQIAKEQYPGALIAP
jgi:branched-chain amino acid transport system substrate-binding protein